MLRPLHYTPFTARELKPAGWLKKQLEIQAAGLSGHLDQVWPDIRDSRWIGGDKDGWERVPYWLDGFIPLAWLLEDKDLQARAKRYIDAILAQQQEDGWICPCSLEERPNYDVWALFLLCKVLVVYEECSQDPRVEEAVYRALRNLHSHIEVHTLFDWAAARWFECLIPIYWLYERRPEDWLLDLAHALRVEGFDYEALYREWRLEKPQAKWTQLSHVVNLAMSLKAGALYSRLSGEDPSAMAKQAYTRLHRDHGMACGHFTGDECLAGTSPIRGSECCSVVEAMYSYEQLLSITGEAQWGDLAEALAFNALPATLSPDMWSHQYDQQTNQVCCTRLPEDHVVFATNPGDSHFFGLEPNFGCCTANFNQGWPKLALSTFMGWKEGLASVILAPSVVSCQIGEAHVTCRLETDYPFRDTLTYTVTTDRPARFPLGIRIPGTVASAVVDGAQAQPGAFFTVERDWSGTQQVQVSFTMETKLERRPNDLYCVKRGPLLYAVAIQEEWTRLEYTQNGVERKYPYCDYEIRPLSLWNYAFADDSFTVEEQEGWDAPFSTERPPISLTGTFVQIDWGFDNGLCHEVPDSRVPLTPPQQVRLIPYGCTNLRMTEMPWIQAESPT